LDALADLAGAARLALELRFGRTGLERVARFAVACFDPRAGRERATERASVGVRGAAMTDSPASARLALIRSIEAGASSTASPCVSRNHSRM
jgi:hypothetical protein